jgi:chromosome partitioning protein
MIIAFPGEKGGPGKSTLTQNIAVCLRLEGHDVVIIDADKQRSTVDWAVQREQLAQLDKSVLSIVCLERRGDMFETLESLRTKYEYVLVDVAGAETPQMSSVLTAADIVYSPFMPSACDLRTAQAMNHLIEVTRHRGNPELRSYAVLNQVAPRPHETRAELEFARASLEPFKNLPLATRHISFRKTFRNAYAAQRGVVELARGRLAKDRDAARLAAAEVWAFYAEVTGNPVNPEEVELHDEFQ